MQELEIKEMFCRPADERAVLSYCMKNLDNYYAVCSKLAPSDFLYSQHELLMLLFQTLSAKGSEVFDANIINAEAVGAGVLDDIGGLKYIQTISSVHASEKNFDIHLNEVVEAAAKFKLFKVMQEKMDYLVENAKGGVSSSELMGAVESSIMDLTVSNYSVNEPINLSNGLREYIEERRTSGSLLTGLTTGFPVLDKQIDGLIPGSLTVIAARKKMGKSAFLTNIAVELAYIQNIPILYVDTEMTFDEFRPRAIAKLAKVSERDIKHGNYDDDTYKRLMQSADIVDSGRLFHEYMPGYSVDKLVALYKKYKYKENIGLIVFDYLKEPSSSSIDRQRKEYQILGDVTTKIKDLAGQLNIPALTAVQLNRDNDVADSDRIARYADVICLWQKRSKEERDLGGEHCGSYKLIVRDSRRGGATSEEGIGYHFFKDKLTIREVAPEHQYFMNVNNHSEDEEGLPDYDLQA